MHVFASCNFAARMQRSVWGLSVCVHAGDFLILYILEREVLHFEPLSHPHSCTHRLSLSASLLKHCSNNPWFAGLSWRTTTTPLGAAPLSSSHSVCVTPMMKTKRPPRHLHASRVRRKKCSLASWAAVTLHLHHPSALFPDDHHHHHLPDYRISHRSSAIC